MNEAIREDLKAYLDGELAPERAAEVQRAVDSDPALREEIEFMRALGFEIKRMGASPAVEGATRTAVAVRRRPRPWWLRLETYAAAGLGVLLIAIIFPVFAQSKEAAKRTSQLSWERMQAGEEADPTATPADSGVVFGGSTGGTGSTGSGGFSAGKENVRGRGGGAPSEAPARADKGGAIAGFVPAPRSPVLTPQLLIRTASLTVKVPSAQKALDDAIRIATSHGGYSSGDDSTSNQTDQAIATVSLRVPVRAFETTRKQILALGEMVENTSNSEDVTTQVADTEARIKVMRAEEESYVTMLRAARKVGELLEIKDRLSQVRQEIESLDAQRRAMRDQASYSTINATFVQRERIGEPEPPKDWVDETWAGAVNGLKAVGRFLGQTAILLFVYSPIWLPVVLIGWWLTRRARGA